MKKFPMDVRTAMNYLNLNPTIYHTFSCPGCFKIYPKYLTKLQLCDHRTTARSKPYNLALSNQNSDCIRQYSKQSFQAWLTSIVQQEKIEDLLAESVNYTNPHPGIRTDLKRNQKGDLWRVDTRHQHPGIDDEGGAAQNFGNWIPGLGRSSTDLQTRGKQKVVIGLV
jgi:hypothetical protein